MTLGKLALRATIGGLMVGHGLQKLNGSFGGPGLESTEQTMVALGLYPAKHQARAAALSKTIGGGLTAAGFLSPLGPAMITGTMAVAVRKVHGKNGVWLTDGGFEYNLTLIAAAFALAAEGPGVLSIDGLLGKQRSGFKWGLVDLVLGLGGAAVTLALANRFRPDSEPLPATADGSDGAEAPTGEIPAEDE